MLNYKDFANKNMKTEKEVTLESMKFNNELNKNGTVKAVADNIWLNQLSLQAIEDAANNNAGKLKIVFRKKDNWKNGAWLAAFDWAIEENKEE